MASNSQNNNWFLDVLILVGFLVAFFLNLTGLVIHQCLGVALALLIIVHFINHWSWIKNVIARFFGKTSNRSRFYAVIDGLLLFGMVMILETGLVISTWFNLDLVDYQVWRDLHVYSSISTLVLAVVKIGLHWRWVVRTAEKIFNAHQPHAQPRITEPKLSRPVPQAAGMDRRQFLVTMGIVGLGSVLAINNVLSKETVVQSAALPENTTDVNVSNNQENVAANSQANQIQTQTTVAQPVANATSIPQATPTSVSVPTSPAALTCSARCPKGRHCSYPGGCGRYTDSNRNGKCDLGECG
jgi:hypothetical protein